MQISSSTSQNQAPVLAIIGNGITGITAARVARKILPDLEIHVISNETDYFFSRTALMYIYMGHMRAEDTEPYERDFYQKNRINLIRDNVVRVDSAGKTLEMDKGKLKYDLLLLATGSRPNKFGWPGQDLEGVTGMYSMQDLEKIGEITKDKPERAVIVGGGLIGIELAEMMHSRKIPVTFLVREASYMNHIFPAEEADMICDEIRVNHIDLRLETELNRIEDDGQGRACAAVTGDGDRLACGLVGLTAGVGPNLSALENCEGIETARGILVDQNLRTSHPDVFAAGDCAQFRNQDGSPGKLEQLWYTGRKQGEVAGRNLAKEALKFVKDSARQTQAPLEIIPYDRGIWFNSAKFFNMEYHTYGFVPNKLDAETTIFWKHPKQNKGIRLVWEQNGADTKITGFNFMGIRYRHETCERWIAEERPVNYVVDNLQEGNFDPEFFTKHEKQFRKFFHQAKGGKSLGIFSFPGV